MVSILLDMLGRKIKLSNERWRHITTVHPEIERYRKEVEETVSDPELVKQSLYSNEVTLYYKCYPNILGGKHIAVVVKLNENKFVITAYITDRIKEGKILWERN